jgi:hypothetical protein
MENMNARYIIPAAIGCVLFLATCKKENMCDCFKRTGDVIKETRTSEPFTSIFVQDRINVILTEDTTLPQEIIVEAGENLLPLIRTEVVNGTLRIRNDNKCDFTRRYDVAITVYIRMSNDLASIINKGTALVSNTDTCTSPLLSLETESAGDIKLNVSGGVIYTHQHSAGDVELYGNASTINIFNTGGGFTISDQCVSPYVWCFTKTTGKITCYPLHQLDCEIEGPGHIYYRGVPILINSTLTGTGQLLPL